jgi:hypothetical protein
MGDWLGNKWNSISGFDKCQNRCSKFCMKTVRRIARGCYSGTPDHSLCFNSEN